MLDERDLEVMLQQVCSAQRCPIPAAGQPVQWQLALFRTRGLRVDSQSRQLVQICDDTVRYEITMVVLQHAAQHRT